MRRKKGFTLIELLVVIAVIALLVSILMPSLQKARWLAMRAVCISNIHSQVLAQHLYAADFRGQFAPRTGPTDPDPQYVRANSDNTGPWAAMHLKYLTIPNMTRCPILAREFGQYNLLFSNMNYTPDGNYGSWGSSALYIYTPYSWFAGFPKIVMCSGETAPPMNAEEASSSGAMVAHRISDLRLSSLRDVLIDWGHGGMNFSSDDSANITTFDQPVGYGDGHVTIHAKPDIKKRFTHFIVVLPGYYDHTDYYY